MPSQRKKQVQGMITATQRLLPFKPMRAPAPARWSPAGLLADWLHTRQSPKTARVYLEDMRCLAAFLECTDEQAAQALLQGRAAAEQIVEHWDRWMRDVRGLAPYTRARRIWAVQSFVKHAAKREVISYQVSIKVPKLVTRRDTTGPDHRKLDKLLHHLAEQDDVHSIRDAALMALMYFCGLRRGEVLTMRLRDCDADRQRLMIVAKGRLALVPSRTIEGKLVDPAAQEPDREVLEGVPRSVWRLLKRWLAVIRKQRPDIKRDAPLWWSLMPSGSLHKRLASGGLSAALRKRLKQGRIRPCTTHGLRHTAITVLLDKSNGNLRLAQAFARHADLRQLARYDDARRGLFAEGAKLVASGLE